jgi:hypothetical protein
MSTDRIRAVLKLLIETIVGLELEGQQEVDDAIALASAALATKPDEEVVAATQRLEALAAFMEPGSQDRWVVENNERITWDHRNAQLFTIALAAFASPSSAPGRGGEVMSKPLSPAAQAAMDAYHAAPIVGVFPQDGDQLGVAAAILALADQVVPEGSACMIRMPETDVDGNEAGGMLLTAEPNARIRAEILAIAAELGGEYAVAWARHLLTRGQD